MLCTVSILLRSMCVNIYGSSYVFHIHFVCAGCVSVDATSISSTQSSLTLTCYQLSQCNTATNAPSRTTSPTRWIWLSKRRRCSYISIIKGKIPTDDVSSFTNLLRFMQLISSNFSHHWILICIPIGWQRLLF